MNKLLLGVLLGIVFAILDVIIMIPLKMADKNRAMLSAFINRFAIGFLIGATDLPLAPWLSGLTIGLLISLPDAIIARVYAPILGFGAVAGMVIGFLVGVWGV